MDFADIDAKVNERHRFTPPKTWSERESNAALDHLLRVEDAMTSTVVDKIKALKFYWHALATAFLVKVNPKQIDLAVLKELVQNGANPDPEISFYKKRINSAVPAIRAFCVSDCMNGDVNAVRNCASATCQFFPFRMGHNVFHGKIEHAEQEVEDEPDVEAAATPIEIAKARDKAASGAESDRCREMAATPDAVPAQESGKDQQPNAGKTKPVQSKPAAKPFRRKGHRGPPAKSRVGQISGGKV